MFPPLVQVPLPTSRGHTFIFGFHLSFQAYPIVCNRCDFLRVCFRSDHLYSFFIQWSPETFGDGMGSIGREPGFMVVKKIVEPEAENEQKTSDSSSKEWEVHLQSAFLSDAFFDKSLLCISCDSNVTRHSLCIYVTLVCICIVTMYVLFVHLALVCLFALFLRICAFVFVLSLCSRCLEHFRVTCIPPPFTPCLFTLSCPRLVFTPGR